MGVEQIKVKVNPDVTPAGSDLAVVNAARRSFNTRSEWAYDEVEQRAGDGEWITQKVNRHLKDKDKRLIEFLARGMTADDFEKFKLTVGTEGTEWLYYMDNNREHNLIDLLWQWRNTPIHDTPFNHCFISFEVQAPVFCRAQLVKHEYLIMSEFSRRYITDGIEFYRPSVWREQSENKKQGSSGEHPLWNHGKGTGYREGEYEHNDNCLALYERMVGMGVAIEQARMVLPQSTMTEWTWSGTLGAFAKMCQLRLHPDAQYEARLVAQQVYDYLKQYYPVSAVALVEGVK